MAQSIINMSMILNQSKKLRLEDDISKLTKINDKKTIQLIISLLCVTELPNATLMEGIDFINQVQADVVEIKPDESNLVKCKFCGNISAIVIRETRRSAEEQDLTKVSCKKCNRVGYISKSTN